MNRSFGTDNPWLHRFAFFTACMTVLLLSAGALVTGTGSGLAVPDWPLSFGQYFPPMVGGVLFEHGHRIIAGTVGILTGLMAICFWIWEPRAWVRRLALCAVLVVIAQATLGGMTVLFRLPPSVSVSHACLAQIFFTLTVLLTLVTSSSWKSEPKPLDNEEGALIPLPIVCAFVNFLFFAQLLMGAVMRHKHAGLAIPDFPLSFGRLVPPEFSFPVAIHFAHRVGAGALIVMVAYLVTRISRRQSRHLGLVANAGALVALLALQFMLGASVVWLRRPIPLTTVHLVVGAMCFATSVALTAQVFRLARVSPAGAPAAWRLARTLVPISGSIS